MTKKKPQKKECTQSKQLPHKQPTDPEHMPSHHGFKILIYYWITPDLTNQKPFNKRYDYPRKQGPYKS